MKFSDAYELPIGKYVEKKGKFSYLSWCYAVRFLRENFPDSTWIIHENADGLPIFTIGQSHLVKVTVRHEDKQYTQWHPILNGANKPIIEPTSFDINTSIHRALTKAIGIATGIGLGLYAGEDLPIDGVEANAAPEIVYINKDQAIVLRDLLAQGKIYNEAAFCKQAGISSVEQLKAERYDKAFQHAQGQIAKEVS